jgi:hypothetical protein
MQSRLLSGISAREGDVSWLRFLNNYNEKMLLVDKWKSFQDQFMELAREEQGRASLAEVVKKGSELRRMNHVLRVTCSFGDRLKSSFFQSNEPPPHVNWKYGNGSSENFEQRARLLVGRSGQTHPDWEASMDPEQFWLHRLYLDLLENSSDQLLAASNEGGMILSVCIASAAFCDRLALQALQRTGTEHGSLGRLEPRNQPVLPHDLEINGTMQRAEITPMEGAAISWPQIQIAFLSDERVEICYGSSRETMNYAEFGFEDRRNGKPNRAWITLREMARQGGVAILLPPAGKERAGFQKRVEEIRKRLRLRFGIQGDPIPFNGNSYQVSFKLYCKRSFES